MSSKSSRRKSHGQQAGRRVFGLINYHGEKRPCGICGVKKRMSKAHVPPQCAGNAMLVKRYRLMVNKHQVDAGRQDFGGIHLFGLCEECNTAAGQYDEAYRDFADVLRPNWVKPWRIQLPKVMSMDPVSFDPGAVVRSILLGMCATGPLIQQHWPDFPPRLLTGKPLEMPPELRLYVALARGLTARVTGPMSGLHVHGPHLRRDAAGAPLGINAVASVYFPPLAWELVYARETELTHDRWADVSSWTSIKPGETRVLRDLVPALPAVAHPRHHPDRDLGWVEILSTEICPILECTNVEGGSADPDAPTLNERRQLDMDEFGDILKRNGLPAMTRDGDA